VNEWVVVMYPGWVPTCYFKWQEKGTEHMTDYDPSSKVNLVP